MLGFFLSFELLSSATVSFRSYLCLGLGLASSLARIVVSCGWEGRGKSFDFLPCPFVVLTLSYDDSTPRLPWPLVVDAYRNVTLTMQLMINPNCERRRDGKWNDLDDEARMP